MKILWMTSLRPLGKSKENDNIQNIFLNSILTIDKYIKFSFTQFDDPGVSNFIKKMKIMSFLINYPRKLLPNGKKYSNKIMLENALKQYLKFDFTHLVYSTADIIIPADIFEILNSDTEIKNNKEFCALVYPNILIKNGFDIYLILPHNGPLSDNEIIKKAKIKIINLGVFRKKYFSFFGLINRLYYIVKSSFHIKNILKKDKIDLVYTNTSTIISSAIAAKFLGLRSIYHIHEIPSSNSIYSRFIANFLNYFSDDVIAVSNAVHEFWLNRGVRGSKIKVIYNGFKYSPKTKKKLPKNKIIFTSISRIIPYKGHSLMIDIFEKLYKKNSTLYLKIIGDTLPEYKNYLSDLKFKVEKKGLSNRRRGIHRLPRV